MHAFRWSALRAPLRSLGMSIHVVAACALAYFASARWVDLNGVILHRLGMARGDAVMAAVMLGFVQFWLILLWAFSRRSVLRTWTALAALALAALLALAVLGVPGGRA